MTDPREQPRDAHPRVTIADPYAADTNVILAKAVTESPTRAVRVYYPGDTDDTADIVTLEGGDLVTIDPGVQ